LAALEISDAGRFRDYLFDLGMSSSSVKRFFFSVRAVINLAIRDQGLSINNVFNGTFIPDDEAKTQRSPIPTDVLVTIQQECMQLDDKPRWLIALISDTDMRLIFSNDLSGASFWGALICAQLSNHFALNQLNRSLIRPSQIECSNLSINEGFFTSIL